MGMSILIVNYNTEKFILNFLQDITQQNIDFSLIEVIIVNNSNNQILKSLLGSNSLLSKLNINIILSQNIGFGRGMNKAETFATQKHLLIANPDLRLTDKDYLKSLLSEAERRKNYGIMTTQLLNSKHEDLSEFYSYEFDQTLGFDNQICWFGGALLLIHKSLYHELNGFDPNFFMYCEDEDLCLRVKKKGLPLIKLNQLKILHIGGSSEPVHDYAFFHRWYKSKILFCYKHLDQIKFNQLLFSMEKKSTYKCRIYKTMSLFNNRRSKFKLTQWQVMSDIIQKINSEGTEWLKYSPK
ncbi:glycosyltransferase family 2 protein [Acinetobacter nectaris]|uniref:glycosyltransferase family 2 protein n=1 Tax=Acinetobacter nectaris TaxID=1219382 RepID=UPI001F3723DB|nr:glycosyltransferase [Acinetobacter nectaris]MCF9046534.1 glycosyltransferase [Acinetobacter nectaris]